MQWGLKITKPRIQVRMCQRMKLFSLSVLPSLHTCLPPHSRNNKAATIFWWSIKIILKCLNLLSTVTRTIIPKHRRNRLAPALASTNSNILSNCMRAEERKASITCATATLNSWQLIRMVLLELRHRGTRLFRYNNRQLLSHQAVKPTSKQNIKDADRLGLRTRGRQQRSGLKLLSHLSSMLYRHQTCKSKPPATTVTMPCISINRAVNLAEWQLGEWLQIPKMLIYWWLVQDLPP